MFFLVTNISFVSTSNLGASVPSLKTTNGTLLCDKDQLVTQASPRDDEKVQRKSRKMETIITYHRHVLAALYPVKEWTNNRAKKVGEMASVR